MSTQKVDVNELDDTLCHIDGIANILLNMSCVPEEGGVELNSRALYFLSEQLNAQRQRIDAAISNEAANADLA